MTPPNYESQRRFHRIVEAFVVELENLSSLGRREFAGLDLSVDGLAFEIQGEETHAITPGTALNSVAFTCDGRRILVDAVVKHVQQIESKRGPQKFKVGVEFTRVDPEDLWLLSGFIAKKRPRRELGLARLQARKKTGKSNKSKRPVSRRKTVKSKKTGKAKSIKRKRR